MTRHPLIAILLALVLAAGTILSGPAMAHPMGTTVELCVEGSTVTVTLDLNGNPAPAHRPCPACLAAQDLAFPPGPVLWTRAGASPQAARLPPICHPVLASIEIIPPARAPPLPV